MGHDLKNLKELLERIQNVDTEGNQVSLEAILDEIGHRSFGPLILVAGLITLAPIIGDIPGVSTIMGVLVFLTAGQLLFQREHFWLPEWLLRRSVSRDKLNKALDWLHSPARFIDRWLRPRLTKFVQDAGTYVIAVTCIIISVAMPAMEFVPFSANGAGVALTSFGLSLIAHDGLMALLALTVTIGTFGVVAYNVL